jgi:hypothetical protein
LLDVSGGGFKALGPQRSSIDCCASMTPSNDSEVANLELRLPSDASLVATVRRFVGDLCKRLLDEPDVTARVVVAAHELFDNATRYAAANDCLLRVELRRSGGSAAVVILTENRASEERCREIVDLLGEMDASVNRESFYVALIRRVANRTDSSGLGLGRVHAESELDLTCSVEGDLVTIRAQGRFSLATGAGIR